MHLLAGMTAASNDDQMIIRDDAAVRFYGPCLFPVGYLMSGLIIIDG